MRQLEKQENRWQMKIHTLSRAYSANVQRVQDVTPTHQRWLTSCEREKRLEGTWLSKRCRDRLSFHRHKPRTWRLQLTSLSIALASSFPFTTHHGTLAKLTVNLHFHVSLEGFVKGVYETHRSQWNSCREPLGSPRVGHIRSLRLPCGNSDYEFSTLHSGSDASGVHPPEKNYTQNSSNPGKSHSRWMRGRTKGSLVSFKVIPL